MAIQQGAYAARSVRAALSGRDMPPFRYRDKGSLATIGRARANLPALQARKRRIIGAVSVRRRVSAMPPRSDPGVRESK